ncbi:methyltransferase domain-containing protein [Noviherbaspirillum aridicola]|uniref:Malonyl-[acyl-carrier protein] O-methyltransferase n=1 Tax=Noviherbaspirillum aridicola TaxID=2849687 RepID=A0ABQ4Q0Y5_9BURK|nr:methyltransferase domain-containing protein [Noviherbaspirillum aridicola]GIZ50836.1 malonyl-[acyl-carrier protein] O-methyltransferase [Noviherbaspirillum aridicola]
MSSPAPDNSASGPIDIGLVRRLFHSPGNFADSDFLRREIAGRMHERLALVKIAPRRVLDIGCADGPDLGRLHEQYPQAEVLGLDASETLLRCARERHQAASSAVSRLFGRWLRQSGGGGPAGLVCGDLGHLPLQTGAVDLVWSNLVLHWHPQPDQVFSEWRRVLATDGLLMFSCFGPDSFREIRHAFAQADHASHALSFVDMHDFGDMLVNAGFSTPVMDMETITVTYESVDKLMADVRAWGGNPLLTRRRGLLGRAAWRRVADALEAMRGGDGRIPLTFEVVYGHAFRPAPRQTASGEAIIRFEPRRK